MKIIIIILTILAAAIYIGKRLDEKSATQSSLEKYTTSTAEPKPSETPTKIYRLTDKRDAMTDELHFSLSWPSASSLEQFAPVREAIVFRFKPTQISRSKKTMKYTLEAAFIGDLSLFLDHSYTIDVRIDSQPPYKVKCVPSENSQALFFDNAQHLLTQIANARRVRLRIENRDYDFPLGLFNLQDIRREMVERILSNPPPGITITP